MGGKVWGCIGIHSTFVIRSDPEGLAKCMAVYGLRLFWLYGVLMYAGVCVCELWSKLLNGRCMREEFQGY